MVSLQAPSNSAGTQKIKKRTKIKEDMDIMNRTAWADAKLALDLIKKNKASGNKPALWLRSKLQGELLFPIGRFIQTHAVKILIVGMLVLFTFCLGLKKAEMKSSVDEVWIEEGGRLERELKYVEDHLGVGSGATNEMIIQTPSDDNGGSSSILSPEALLSHMHILKAASRVVVERDDTAWKLKDLCYAQTIPLSELQILDDILDNLFPCAIITPLDCFWEGSKLLGPDMPVHIPLGGDEGSMLLSWTTLNPMQLLRQMSSFSKYFDFHSFEEYMKRAGITSGYQEKPCLDPYDPDCPQTAPNKHTKQTPDIGAELTGGCYGFATRYNHWPEELVVGGVVKNRTGHIVRAKGLQSVVQLMGEKDLYDYWSETYKTHTLDWSQQRAKEILAEWQAKFSEEVNLLLREKDLLRKYDINAFSTSHLDTIMEEFSEFSYTRLALGYVFMILYAALALFRWNDVVKSQSGLGIGGVVLVTATIGAGLGLCALLGISFNATTSQIVPYLALGLGVDAMFLMVQQHAEHLVSGTIAFEDQIGEVLSRTGVLIILIGGCVIASFLLASALIPIPAMRGLGLQAAILGAFNLVSMIFLFPAILALDVRRVAADKIDLLCCFSTKRRNLSEHFGVAEKQATDEEGTHDENEVPFKEDQQQNAEKEDEETEAWSLPWFAANYYAHWLCMPRVKLLITVAYILLTLTGFWGIAKVEDGLNLTEIVPRNTSVFKFLDAQDKYFGFYNMYAVTQGNFEYPQNQKLLYDYHNAFVRVPNIIKDDNGGLPEFWLSLFRTWLVKVQNVFDDNYALGHYKSNGWHENATDEGILAFKLMVQTGHVDYPIDFTLQTRNRLVDAHGIINPSAFYNYMTAWYSNDAMAYSFSQANIMPKPREWVHNPLDEEMRIPKSPPIAYAQIPFYLNKLGETQVVVDTIRQVRELCGRFETERGLPNFPRGVPFTFWEQYLTLRFWLLLALVCMLVAVFVILAFVFMSVRLSLIGVAVIMTMLVQLFGFMGLMGIKLSAIPAVMLILAGGMGVQFTVHVLMGFATSIGSKNRRVYLSLKHMLSPVCHGAISTFLGILMLAFSDFDFIYRYFFLVLTALLSLGLFNGLAFLPVLLAFLGPPAEVIPANEGDTISLPSPEPVRQKTRPKIHVTSSSRYPTRSSSSHHHEQQQQRSSSNRSGNVPRRHNSDASLSTIAEESNSYVSTSRGSCPETQSHLGASFNGASVFVEPEVIVETTTLPMNGSSTHSSRCSTPSATTTKVTATAKFKVEVHAPSGASMQASSFDRPATRRSRRGSSGSSKSKKDKEPSSVQSSLSESLPSSLASSLSSSNDGDPGFSEK